jgi:hypothetical protein
VDVDVGECTVGAEGAVMVGGAVPPDAHVSRLNCVVVVRGGATCVCRRRRARPVPPQALYPSPNPRVHTNRVTCHATVSGAKTSACSAAAASRGVEARM